MDKETIDKIFEESEHRFSNWGDMAEMMYHHEVPYDVIKKLPDVVMTKLRRKPTLNLFELDDWIHKKYGNYEDEGKSMNDMFDMIFQDDSVKVAKYFGVEK